MWRLQCLKTYTRVIWQTAIWQTAIDPHLHRASATRFGVEPTVRLFKHSTPLLTDPVAFQLGIGFVRFLRHR